MNGRLTVLLSLATVAGAAHAFELNIGTTALGGNVHWTLNGGSDRHTFAGELDLQIVGGADYKGFCSDAAHTAHTGDFSLTDTTQLSSPNAGKIAFLVNTFQPTLPDAQHGIALQLAIWELLYDSGTYDVTTGNFKVTSIDGYNNSDTNNTYAMANNFANTAGSSLALFFKPDGENQSFVAPVPEPASLVTLGLGLAALISRRRRK